MPTGYSISKYSLGVINIWQEGMEQGFDLSLRLKLIACCGWLWGGNSICLPTPRLSRSIIMIQLIALFCILDYDHGIFYLEILMAVWKSRTVLNSAHIFRYLLQIGALICCVNIVATCFYARRCTDLETGFQACPKIWPAFGALIELGKVVTRCQQPELLLGVPCSV